MSAEYDQNYCQAREKNHSLRAVGYCVKVKGKAKFIIYIMALPVRCITQTTVQNG